MKKLALILVCAVFSACTSYSISDVDVSRKDSICTRRCIDKYLACISSVMQNDDDGLHVCKDVYQACTSSCPSKFAEMQRMLHDSDEPETPRAAK